MHLTKADKNDRNDHIKVLIVVLHPGLGGANLGKMKGLPLTIVILASDYNIKLIQVITIIH